MPDVRASVNRPTLTVKTASTRCEIERVSCIVLSILHTLMPRREPSNMNQRTVAIFTDGGFLAHVTRSFEVGRALVDCFGHHVVFCGAGPYMHIPLEAGFEVWPVYTVDRDVTMKLARRAGLCSLG